MPFQAPNSDASSKGNNFFLPPGSKILDLDPLGTNPARSLKLVLNHSTSFPAPQFQGPLNNANLCDPVQPEAGVAVDASRIVRCVPGSSLFCNECVLLDIQALTLCLMHPVLLAAEHPLT